VNYPLDPLIELMTRGQGLTEIGYADPVRLALGINPQSWRRYRRDGVTFWQADRLACAAGYHPSLVWGPMFWDPATVACTMCDETFVVAPCHSGEGGHLYCSTVCRSRAARARRRVAA